MCRKRPFATQADRRRPRLEGRRPPVAGPAARRAAGEGIDDAANLYHDFASGVRDDRPGLDSCLRALRKGDVLVVWKLDRLGRNLAHLILVQDDQPVLVAVSAVYKSSLERNQQRLVSTTKVAPN